MGRPNRPYWHADSRCFRCVIAGQWHYFPKSIGRDDRPQIDGIPKAVWDHLETVKAERNRRRVNLADPTFDALVEVYVAHLERQRDAGEFSANAFRSTGTQLAKFQDFAPAGSRPTGELLARDLDPDEHLGPFVAWMKAEGYSDHYIANCVKSVQACLNWSARVVKDREPRQLIAVNPLAGVRPVRPSKESDRYVDPAAVRVFLRWAWKRAKYGPKRTFTRGGKTRELGARKGESIRRRFDLIFVRLLWFLFLTGARPGEACGAEWEFVDWRRDLLVLDEWKNAKKTGKKREIHMTPDVRRLLRRLERLPDRHPDFIFTHALGRGYADKASPLHGWPWDSSALAKKVRDWRKEAKAAGLPVVTEGAGRLVAYILRHTYISEGLMAGFSEAEIANLTGTSAQMVAETYGHIQREHAARRARELGQRLKKGQG
jgi:integrase